MHCIKTFEEHVRIHLLSCLDETNIINKNRHGSGKPHSPVTELIHMNEIMFIHYENY